MQRRRHIPRHLCAFVMALMLIGGCKDDSPPDAPVAAKVANPTTEAKLTTVTLSSEAVIRLGVETAAVESTTVGTGRVIGGVVMAPPGHSLIVSAPFAGTVLVPAAGAIPSAGATVSRGQALLRLAPLPPDRDLQRTDESLDIARARLQQVQREADRARKLHAEQLVSTRDLERAEAELIAARAALATADAQQRLVAGGGRDGRGIPALVVTAPASGTVLALNVGSGQTVPAGSPLLEVVELGTLWVRVPVFSGELAGLNRRGAVSVAPLGTGAEGMALRGTPVTAPPTADPASSSVDLYYAISGGAGRLRPGERVNVTMPGSSSGDMMLTIPAGAVVHDIYGGAWVYERVDSVTFVRRRVEIGRITGGRAALTRGPAPGTMVVTSGAAELFGVEFGPGK